MLNEKSSNFPMVYVYDEGVLGELIKYNAHASLIRYKIYGITYEILIFNEDFEIIEELRIGLDDYDY